MEITPHTTGRRQTLCLYLCASLTCVLLQNHNTRVLRHNTDLAEMQARFDRAHTRAVEGEGALVRLETEVSAKTIMFGNIVTYVRSVVRLINRMTATQLPALFVIKPYVLLSKQQA